MFETTVFGVRMCDFGQHRVLQWNIFVLKMNFPWKFATLTGCSSPDWQNCNFTAILVVFLQKKNQINKCHVLCLEIGNRVEN